MDDSYINFLKHRNTFAFELYKAAALQNSTASVNISPLSLQTATTLVLIGSTGETALQLSTAMKIEHLTKELLAENYKTLISNTSGDSSFGLKVSHKMYLPKKRRVSTEFIEIATQKFDTEIRNLNFANSARCAAKINEWVEKKMQKRGDVLIDSADAFNQDTCVVLVNVTYFDGTWARPFNRYRTTKKPFWLNETEGVAVNMMNITERFGYVELDELDAKAIELNYNGSEVSLVVVLPNEKSLQGLEKLEKKLENFDLADLVKVMTEQYVNLSLPRFKTGCNLKMSEVFTKMQMDRMFTDDAELDAMLEKGVANHVSEMFHKTILEVNENGTISNVAAGMSLTRKNTIRFQTLPPEFTVNHPFLYFLKGTDNVIVFIGSVKNGKFI